jgi:hypothetical protein
MFRFLEENNKRNRIEATGKRKRNEEINKEIGRPTYRPGGVRRVIHTDHVGI